jgi:hypothetical protein
MRVLLVFALAACSAGSHGPAGPAWPAASARDGDGGESLTPRAAARAIATVVEDDRPADRTAADKLASPLAGPGVTGDRPAAAAAATSATAPPEELTGEDLVIEIED